MLLAFMISRGGHAVALGQIVDRFARPQGDPGCTNRGPARPLRRGAGHDRVRRKHLDRRSDCVDRLTG
jgi:hypothetical protein